MALRSQPLAMGLKQITGLADAVDDNDAVNKAQLDGGLAGKANTVHTHVIGDVTGLQTALDGKEPALPSGGTTSQFLRGDKTWQAISQKLVGSYHTKLTAQVSISSSFPTRTTAPTTADGTQILSLTVTTTTATQVIDFWFHTYGVMGVNTTYTLNGAVFVNGTAVAVAGTAILGQTGYGNLVINNRFEPGAAGTYTLTVRLGLTVTGFPCFINSQAGTAGSTSLIAHVIEP